MEQVARLMLKAAKNAKAGDIDINVIEQALQVAAMTISKAINPMCDFEVPIIVVALRSTADALLTCHPEAKEPTDALSEITMSVAIKLPDKGGDGND